MLDEIDAYEYVLAERLGMTRKELIERIGNDEYIRWKAFDTWRAEMSKLHG